MRALRRLLGSSCLLLAIALAPTGARAESGFAPDTGPIRDHEAGPAEVDAGFDGGEDLDAGDLDGGDDVDGGEDVDGGDDADGGEDIDVDADTVSPDATTARGDAARAPDSGRGDATPSGGCSCAVGGGASDGSILVLALAVASIIARGRRPRAM
jgi:MYXO-CTERM domain-containing protein